MKQISLSDAVLEIVLAAQRTPAGSLKPYVMIFGAGVSAPQIPLASAVEEHCIEEARKVGRDVEILEGSAVARYSHIFNLAYPHALDRQRYLRGLIDGKPLSKASLRLAHLLLDGSVAQIAITPNFDDFVTRALTLFGAGTHRLCDHPNTVDRIDPESAEIQVVHVHGTHWFYDLCNLRTEIDDRAQLGLESSSTMLALLDRLLANRSALVLGYSGWEGDVIMTALRRRLFMNRRLPFRLYWFCYSESALRNLPVWLSEHPDVFFVIPDVARTEGIRDEGIPPEHVVNFSAVRRDSMTMKEPTLGAVTVLDAILRGLRVEEPEITRDPLLFFTSALRRTLSQEDLSETNDLYAFSSVIARLQHAHEHAVLIDREVERFRNAIRRSQYADAIAYAAELSLKDLNREQVAEVLFALYTASTSETSDQEISRRGFETILAMIDASHNLNDDAKISDLEHNAILCLVGLLDASEAQHGLTLSVKLADEVREGIGSSNERFLAAALFWVQHFSGALTQPDQRLAAQLEIIEKFGSSSDAEVQNITAHVMVGVGSDAYFDNRLLDAVSWFEMALGKYQGNAEEDVVQSLAYAALWKTRCLAAMQQYSEAISFADAMYARYGSTTSELTLEPIVSLLITKGEAFENLEDSSAAEATYNSALMLAVQRNLNSTCIVTVVTPYIMLFAVQRRFSEGLAMLERHIDVFEEDSDRTRLLRRLRTLSSGHEAVRGSKKFLERVDALFRNRYASGS